MESVYVQDKVFTKMNFSKNLNQDFQSTLASI